MKLLKAKLSTPKKVVFKISDLAITQHGFKLQEILDGQEMINPIEVHKCTNEGTYGALGRPYKKGLLKVMKGSQRIGAAKELGYTHIEGIYV